MNLKELLDFVTGLDGGAFIIVSWGFAWAMENFEGWQKLTSKARSLIVLAVSLILGLGTVWLQTQPELVAAAEPYAQTAIYIILAWLGTQLAHKVDPKRKENNGVG